MITYNGMKEGDENFKTYRISPDNISFDIRISF